MAPPQLRQRFTNGPILKGPDDLADPLLVSEQVAPVHGARVVLADYDLLQHDFEDLRSERLLAWNPGLQSLGSSEQREAICSIIDAWLVANSAFVSLPQASRSEVNTPIAVGSGSVTAYRLPRYGRTIITSLENNPAEKKAAMRWRVTRGGLLDVKGAGVEPNRIPSNAEHSNGLEYLAQALQDFLLKRVLDEIFRRAAPGIWTVPVYAILDLGFDLKDPERGLEPAGAHVRRGHTRPLFGMEMAAYGSVEEAVKFEIEMLIRNYGLTSANRGGSIVIEGGNSVRVSFNKRPLEHLLSLEERDFFRTLKGDNEVMRFDGVNIQLTREVSADPVSAHLVDFGHYNVRKRFSNPIVSLARDRAFAIGNIVWPHDLHFVQPDRALRIPRSLFRRSYLEESSFKLARMFRTGQASRRDVSDWLEEPIEALVAKWERCCA